MEIPVPIERIIEYGYDMTIQTQACLRELAEVDAFIDHRCTTIYVDGHVWLSPPHQPRLRFSLAHELAHRILHKGLLEQLPFESIPEWKARYKSIDHDQLSWLEFQANALGGLLVVPDAILTPRWKHTRQSIAKGNEDLGDYLDELAIELLARDFGVSKEVMERRCRYDELLPPAPQA